MASLLVPAGRETSGADRRGPLAAPRLAGQGPLGVPLPAAAL